MTTTTLQPKTAALGLCTGCDTPVLDRDGYVTEDGPTHRLCDEGLAALPAFQDEPWAVAA